MALWALDLGDTLSFSSGNVWRDSSLPSQMDLQGAGDVRLAKGTPNTALVDGSDNVAMITAAEFETQPAPAPSCVSRIEFIGEATFPTGSSGFGTQIGGLSGITFDPERDRYYALSDDRNNARFYTLRIDLSDGFLDDGDVVFTGVTKLTAADGKPFPAGGVDPEGIALADGDVLYIASEGVASDPTFIDPFIGAFTLDGKQLRTLSIDEWYMPDPSGQSGIRNNLSFESLTISPGENTLYAGIENALIQDGPKATFTDASPSRILQYDLATGSAVAEYVYVTGKLPVEPVPHDAHGVIGLVELLATDDAGTLLALERYFSSGVPSTANNQGVLLYEVSTHTADNVKDVVSLRAQPASKVVDKKLLLDLRELGIVLDNLEGLTWGPDLADGDRSLIMVSDNNFSDTQFTQFLAFAVSLDGGACALPM